MDKERKIIESKFLGNSFIKRIGGKAKGRIKVSRRIKRG